MNTSNSLPILKRLSLLAGLLIVVASTLTAKAPEPPTLGISVLTPQASNISMFRLEWKSGQPGDAATGYRIYQSKTVDPSGSMGNYEQIGTTEKTIFEIPNPALGITYVFYVTAYNADGESKQSNLVKAWTDGKSEPTSGIKFITGPISDATVGSPYVYKAQAVDANGGKVLYKMTQPPLGAPIPYVEGMTINRETGVVEWMPKSEGAFAAAVVAYLASDSTTNAMQTLIISVKAPACAMIHGTVIDANGTLIENGWVTAVSADGSNGANWNISSSTELVGGKYSLPVSKGTYIIYLKHPQIGAVWYRNATDVSNAERVIVNCNDTIQADFAVTVPPQPTYFTLAGRVTARSDGHGVQATVSFQTRDKNGRTLEPDKGTVNPSGTAVTTDADGNYSVQLSDEFGYIAQAIPNGEDLLPQYFNGVSNPTEATLLTVATGKVLINFSLSPRPVYNNAVGGSVKDKSGLVAASQVIAIHLPDGSVNTDPGKDEFARSSATGDDGAYILKNLVPGDYVLLAIPNSRDYVPGYFVTGGSAALNWKEATRISIGETTGSMQNDIILNKRDGTKGFAKLSGYIKVVPGTTRSRNVTLGSDLLPGVFVYALDPDSHVSDYTFSDPSGWFELNELGATDYRIMADKVGYLSQAVAMSLDYDGRASVEQDLTLTPGTSSVSERSSERSMLSVYPNPASSRLLLRFDAQVGKASLTIANALGQTVYATSVNAIDGTNSLTIDIATFATGSYRAQLQSGTTNSSVPFTIVR